MTERFFNTAGPTRPLEHYHIPPLNRLDWEGFKPRGLSGLREIFFQQELQATVASVPVHCFFTQEVQRAGA